MYPRDVVKISVLLALRLAANIFKERRPQVSAALTTKCGAELKHNYHSAFRTLTRRWSFVKADNVAGKFINSYCCHLRNKISLKRAAVE